MSLSVRGKTKYVVDPIVGKLTKDSTFSKDDNRILFLDNFQENKIEIQGIKAIIANNNDLNNLPKPIEDIPIAYGVNTIDNFDEGDIVVIHPGGTVRTLFQINSSHNFLFATDRCNSNCLMCSQPPKDKEDIPYLYNINNQVIELIPKNTEYIGITGGEPTLMGEYFYKLLIKILTEIPNAKIHVLTNGRVFAWNSVVKKINEFYEPRITFAIPFYSDYYKHHDYIVQARDAYSQTILGIHNLGRYDMQIEIRIVLHKQSISRLTKLAKFIYNYMPYVSHVAFMGLEYTGYTKHNDSILYIDPINYINELDNSINFLVENQINVSIYNLQLCLLPKNLWKYCRKSISDWKQTNLDECKKCSKSDECCGVFETSKKYTSNIKAFS